MSRVLAEPHTVAEIEARELELHRRLRDFSTASIRAELKQLAAAKPLAEADEAKAREDAELRLARAIETLDAAQAEVLSTADAFCAARERASVARAEYDQASAAARKLGIEFQHVLPGRFPDPGRVRMAALGGRW